MFSIGEFARLGTVSVRTLRHYDEIGLLRPAKVDPETGYRGYYEHDHGQDVTVYLALPVAEPPAELPEPARYLVLPEIEAAVAVRTGPAAGIFPVVYHDLARWADEHGYQVSPPGREVWVHEVHDIAEVSQQVIEIQLPFRRLEAPPAQEFT